MVELCKECFNGCHQQLELGFFVPINLVVSASVSRVKCVLMTCTCSVASLASLSLPSMSVCHRLLLDLQQLCVERALHSTAGNV